tara:strand:- start:18332 stop:20095 length:1764 start_codon:yes stop_codon:yes gene_type:complete
MYKILLSLFVLLISFTAKADDCRGDRPQYDEQGNLIIYICKSFIRNSSDLTHKTYSYEVVSPDKNSIQKVSSLNVVQSGPDGQLTSTFTRGTNSNHTLITLNGISIQDNSTPNGTEDLFAHSFLGVSHVEVIKGPMGSIYGPNAIGGVINMVTQANGDNYIELSGGSFGHKKQIIKLGKADYSKGFIIDFRIENETADGISVVDGTEKDGLSDRNYIFQIEKFLGNWVLKTNLIQTNNKSDLDKSTDYTNYTSDWDFNNQYISLQSKDTEFSFQKTKHKRTYDDQGTKDIYNSDQETFIASHTFHLNNNIDMTTGFEHNLQEIDFDTNIAGYDSNVDKERHNHGYWFNIDNQLDNGVFVHTGLRHDTPNTFDDQTTGRIAIENNGVHISYATGYKAPTVYEMYGKNNYGFLGNKNLIPEKSRTWEIGIKEDDMSFVYFESEIDNLLKYESNTYVNDTKTSEQHGFELNNRYNFEQIQFHNKLSYTVSKDGDGKDQLRRPNWQNTATMYYNNFYVDWNYYGEHKDIDASTYARKDMKAVDTIDIGYNLTKDNTTFFWSINNLFNERYERPDGYNQYDRNINLGFRKYF